MSEVKIDPNTASLADVQAAVLASTKECPDTAEFGVQYCAADIGSGLYSHKLCHGSGCVPLFPELWEKCKGEITDDGELTCISGSIECGFEEFHYTGGWCSTCGGTGRYLHYNCHGLSYVPTEDMGKLTDCLLSLGYEPKMRGTRQQRFVELFHDWSLSETLGEVTGETWQDALWRAILMAMQETAP